MNCRRFISAIARANTRINGGGIALGIVFGAAFGTLFGKAFSLMAGGRSGDLVGVVAAIGAGEGVCGAVVGTCLLRILVSEAKSHGGSQGDIAKARSIAVLILAGIAGVFYMAGAFQPQPSLYLVTSGGFFVGGVLAMLIDRSS